MANEHPLPQAQAALDRMKRANDRGTGCHLTAEMIRELGFTSIGETWGEENPCKAKGASDE